MRSRSGFEATVFYQMLEPRKSCRSRRFQLALMLGVLGIDGSIGGGARAQQATFAGNAQHTGSMKLPRRRSPGALVDPIDLVNTGALAHYGAPLITHSNTVLTPVKHSWISSKRLRGSNRPVEIYFDHRLSLPTPPTNSWCAGLPASHCNASVRARLYYAGAGGRFIISQTWIQTRRALRCINVFTRT